MRYLASISLRSTNSSISMVLVDSSATFSSSSFVTSTKVSVFTLYALDDVLIGNLLAGVGIDLGILDPVAGLSVQLVEGDLFGFRRGRIERDGAGDERKAKEAFPIGAGGHGGGTPIRRGDRKDT